MPLHPSPQPGATCPPTSTDVTRELTVLIADRHPVVWKGLASLLQIRPDMRIVGEVADGPGAVSLATALNPDLVVLDVTIPGGEAAVARLRPDRRVVVLTECEDAACLRRVLAAGAAGYVLKRSPAGRVVQAIRAAAEGGTYLDPEIAGSVLSDFLGTAQEPSTELSTRETQVLRMIAQGYSNKEIAARMGLSVKTIETYKARAVEKLGMHSRVDIVRYACTRGWMGENDPPLLVPAVGPAS